MSEELCKHHIVNFHEVITYVLIPSNSMELELKVANSRPLTVVLNYSGKKVKTL